MTPVVALTGFALLCALAAALFWPRVGLGYRVLRRLARSDAELAEDALKALFHGRVLRSDALGEGLGVSDERARRARLGLETSGLVAHEADGSLRLTDLGRSRALHIVRAHRLWERYLADRTGIAEDEWHEAAERQEHRLTPADTDRLAARMGRPLLDPHGDPIPGARGELHELDGESLLALAQGDTAEILHLEDEPAEPYRRLLEAHLAPGHRVEVIERTPAGVRLRVDGAEVVLDADAADAVTIRRTRAPDRYTGRTLASLSIGASGRILSIAPSLRGQQRRRLMDLGFVPGTVVRAEMHSAGGDPVAYRVRRALIALRHEQASLVRVEPL